MLSMHARLTPASTRDTHKYAGAPEHDSGKEELYIHDENGHIKMLQRSRRHSQASSDEIVIH